MSRSPQPAPAYMRKEKWTNAVLCLLVLGVGWFYFFSQFLPFEKPARDSFKAAASLLFVACCLTNLLFVRRTPVDKNIRIFQKVLFIGQVFACAGDIVLNFHFIGGAALFAIGHVLFLAAFLAVEKPKIRDAGLAAAIAAGAVCLLTFYPAFSFGGVTFVVYAYTVIISCMLAKGISLALSKQLDGWFRLTVLLGTLLFFLSDLMLVFHQFAGAGTLFDFFCLLLYYPAECFLALSVLASRRSYKRSHPPAAPHVPAGILCLLLFVRTRSGCPPGHPGGFILYLNAEWLASGCIAWYNKSGIHNRPYGQMPVNGVEA